MRNYVIIILLQNDSSEVESSDVPTFLSDQQIWKWSGDSYKRPGRGSSKKIFYKSISRGDETISVRQNYILYVFYDCQLVRFVLFILNRLAIALCFYHLVDQIGHLSVKWTVCGKPTLKKWKSRCFGFIIQKKQPVTLLVIYRIQ